MSVSAPPAGPQGQPPAGPGAPPPQHEGPPTPEGGGSGGASSMHDLAASAAQSIGQLATGLAHAGAAPAAVAQLTQMASKLMEVVKVLNEGPSLEQGAQSGQAGPPTGEGGPPGAGPPGAGGPQGQPPMGPHAALGHATDQLHAAMIASANRGAQPPQGPSGR